MYIIFRNICKIFETLLFESILEYWIYEHGYIQEYLPTDRPGIIPVFYFRRNERKDVLFSRETLNFQNCEQLDDIQKKQLEEVVASISQKTFSFYDYIMSYNRLYSFLFTEDYEVANPELLSDAQRSDMYTLLEKEPENFYALQAKGIVLYHSEKDDLYQLFKFILECDPDNPFVLSRLGRYEWSSLFKKYRDPKMLVEAKKSLLFSYKYFDSPKPPYIYGWIGYIYLELEEAQLAIDFFDSYIEKNKKISCHLAEPYIWKGKALTLQEKYRESQDLLLWVDGNKKLNDKKDFRYYITCAVNELHLENTKWFGIYLEKVIEKFFEVFESLEFSYEGEMCYITESKTYFCFPEKLQNSYNAFSDYVRMNEQKNEAKVILAIAFLYKEQLLGRKVFFHNTRLIESLCFSYLQSLYYEA